MTATPSTRTTARTAGLLVLAATSLALSGCVTRAEYVQHDAEMRRVLRDTQTRVSQLQKEVDRLRGDMETGGGKRGGGDLGDRLAAIEDRLNGLEGKATTGGAPSAVDMSPGAASEPSHAGQPGGEVAHVPPPTVPAPPPVATDDWAREVQQEQAAVSAMNLAEKNDFLQIMDGVARKDCTRAIDQLNGFVNKKKDSPLADDALYWAARCYLQKGDQNQAISKFYEVGTKYPKGDRTPAALLAQADLFVKMGNTPDARIVLARLTNYYPSTDEAAKARQKLAELGH